MIQTGQSRVPWPSVIMLCLVSGVAHLVESGVSGTPMGFLLARFTVHPVVITALGMIAPAMVILISPYVSWKSDRVWTRWGRRKPFLVLGFLMAAVVMVLTPFSHSLWMLLVMIVLLYFAHDAGYTGTYAPLLYEVVPKPQRGRAAVMKRYSTDLIKMTIAFVMIAQWENIYRVGASITHAVASTMPAVEKAAKAGKHAPEPGKVYEFVRPSFLPGWFHVEITGAHLLYFVYAFLVLVTAIWIAFAVKETKPEQTLARERFNPIKFLVELARDRQMVMVAILLFCGSTLAVALAGYLPTVMLKEQFGYSVKDFAYITSGTTIIMTCIVMPIALTICDWVPRRTLYRWGLMLGTLHHLGMWIVIKYVGVPSVKLWLVMVGVGLLVDTTAGLALEPLVFDMVPREKMGTINSGFLFISKILGLITAPLFGVFIYLYSFGHHVYATRTWSHENLQWDYSSGFLVYFVLGSIGCFLYLRFVEPQWRKGSLTKMAGESAPDPAPVPVASR
jgi:Na+/melibiose symporter-like transporter